MHQQLHAQAEDFLGTLSRAVIAELDGSLADVQLLFGVNTVARAEFQRILQELMHWSPLVEVLALASLLHLFREHSKGIRLCDRMCIRTPTFLPPKMSPTRKDDRTLSSQCQVKA